MLARSGLSFTMDMEVERLPPDALDRAANGEVVTLTSDTDDRVRALVRLDGFGDAFLFVGRFVDANVLGFMERTQQLVSEYQQMERDRSGIQVTSALIFGIVALLLLFAAVWIGLNFANELAAPISRLIVAADRVRMGDLLARVPEGPESRRDRRAVARLQPHDEPAGEPAARADRGQPAARRAAALHRGRAGRRQRRRDRARRRAGASSCPTVPPSTSSAATTS